MHTLTSRIYCVVAATVLAGLSCDTTGTRTTPCGASRANSTTGACSACGDRAIG